MQSKPTPYRRFPTIDGSPRCWNCDADISRSPSGVCFKCKADNGPALAAVKNYRCRRCGSLLFKSAGGYGRIQTVCAKRQCHELQTVFLEPPTDPRHEPRERLASVKPHVLERERRWRQLLSDPADFMRVMEEKWRAAAAIRARERAEMSVGLRFDVLKRDGFRCRYCGVSVDDGAVLHVDHVMPRDKGGPTTLDNLVTACIDCNLGKSNKELTNASK